MRLGEQRLSLTALGWLGAIGTVLLVIASRIDLIVVAVATPCFAFFVLVALLSSPTYRVDVERRRSTLRVARDFTALLQDCAELDDFDAIAERVATTLAETLGLRACWFEEGTRGEDLPELLRDGDVTTRVHLRLHAGLVLPPLTALPVRGPSGTIGRFVLESDPDIGLSLERRTLAVAMAQVVGVAAATAWPRG